MKDLIKAIRVKMGLNQEQLAMQLGVSPITVNRWENGKAKPTVLAQNKLYEVCREAKIDLADGNIFITLLCSASFIYFYVNNNCDFFTTR